MSAPATPAGPPTAARSELVELARSIHGGSQGDAPGSERAGAGLAHALADAADQRTRDLVDGFVHQAGPPPDRFAWVALGSHARGELHCASDQDHALIWQTERAASSGYAADLAAEVIGGLSEFGLRRCEGGYMADRWSAGLAGWLAAARARMAAPTPEAVLDTDIFLDLRRLAGELDVTPAADVLLAGADSPRLMHGLATAACSFPTALNTLGRLPRGTVDLKRTGLAPTVLLARLYGLLSRSTAVGTVDRLEASASAGVLSEKLCGRLIRAHNLLTRLRLRTQLAQVDAVMPLSDRIVVEDLPVEEQHALRKAFRAVRAAQSVTSVTFRTGL